MVLHLQVFLGLKVVVCVNTLFEKNAKWLYPLKEKLPFGTRGKRQDVKTVEMGTMVIALILQ
jgi:hypothetical protein